MAKRIEKEVLMTKDLEQVETLFQDGKFGEYVFAEKKTGSMFILKIAKGGYSAFEISGIEDIREVIQEWIARSVRNEDHQEIRTIQKKVFVFWCKAGSGSQTGSKAGSKAGQSPAFRKLRRVHHEILGKKR